jgi:glycosyltransferase involved in cell wall biosynthesis
LRTSYLLHVEGNPGAHTLDEDAAARFLLWFAVEGRHQYHHVVFSPEYVGFLAAPAPPFLTRLAAHVHAARGEPQDVTLDNVDAFHAWYYVVGVHELRLAPLVVARERRFLSEDHPRLVRRGLKISRWDYFRFLVRQQATASRPHRAALEQREVREWLARNPTAAAPWHCPYPLWDLSSRPGINVIGSADAVSGMGEDARALSEALLDAGVQHAVFNVRYPAQIVPTDRFGLEAYVSDRPLYPVNVFCLPPFETARLKLTYGDNLFSGRYNVGYWPWELSSLPPSWHFAFEIVDEIWASSRFLVGVFRQLTSTPVTYMPPYVGVGEVCPFARERFGLTPTDVVFLSMFDFNSYVARKNPMAAIEAFRLAFQEEDGSERLLIKTINGQVNPQALAELRQLAATDPRIVIADGSLARSDVCGLLKDVDCLVSLHRSEGFGRILAEAMLLGTPVIATDWSGSASFVNKTTGLPVSYTLRSVRADEYVYTQGSTWAEPSIEDAARKMRLVRHNPRVVASIAAAAGQAVRQTYGLGAAASRLKAWISAFATQGSSGPARLRQQDTSTS